MTDLQWGALPDWVTIAGNLGPVLFRSIQKARQKQAGSWPEIVQQLVNLPADAIQHILDENPAVAEVVAQAWEVAARSARQEKRRLLARVAANALNHPGDSLDELIFLQRALADLEPADLSLLVLISKPHFERGQLAQTPLHGYLTHDDLLEAWPEAKDFMAPMVALLMREGLIENRALASPARVAAAWAVTDFGRRLLAFLSEDESWGVRSDAAEVAMRLEDTGPVSFPNLVIRNIGQGTAFGIELLLPQRSDGGSILVDKETLEAFDLHPGLESRMALYPYTVSDHPPYTIQVSWRDGTGTQQNTQRLVRHP